MCRNLGTPYYPAQLPKAPINVYPCRRWAAKTVGGETASRGRRRRKRGKEESLKTGGSKGGREKSCDRSRSTVYLSLTGRLRGQRKKGRRAATASGVKGMAKRGKTLFYFATTTDSYPGTCFPAISLVENWRNNNGISLTFSDSLLMTAPWAVLKIRLENCHQ